jgi:hypothetical protein
MPLPLNPLANTLEVFSASIEDFITSLGAGIAQAQTALDQNSIKTQEAIDSDPVASHYGLQAAWYQFPKVDLELKLSLTVAEDQTSSSPASSQPSAAARAISPLLAARLTPVRLVAQPVSASYQNHFNFDATAASTLTLSIVPVPAQRTAGQALQPRMTQSKVKAAAFASPAKFALAVDAQNKVLKDAEGVPIPAVINAQGDALRLDVNFNGASGLWYVLQYAPLNSSVQAVVVAVDDAIGSQPGIDPKSAVRVISTP